jgi:apolipoprotein N-acyltransferase
MLQTDASAGQAAFLGWRASLALALASAVLLWLSFYPMNWGWLGWVALVPLLFLTQKGRPWRQALWASWIGGAVFCLVAYQWIRVASLPMYATWIGLALMMSLQFPLFIWIVRRLTHTLGLPLALSAPVTWTALEFFRAIIGIGFAWYYLGHTQHELLPLIQFSDLTGAYGVSFLLVLANVAIFELIVRRKETGRRRIPASLPIALLLVAAALGYGSWRLGEADFQPGPRLAIIQGNLEQDIRNNPNEAEATNNHYRDLALAAARLRPDLIIGPETAWALWYDVIDPATPAEQISPEWRQRDAFTRKLRADFAAGLRADFLFGFVRTRLLPAGDSPNRERRYNAAVHVGADAAEKGWYGKMYLLPFGEYLPLKNSLPFLKALSPYDYEYSTEPGEEFTIFSVKGFPFAALICYEDTVPHLARAYLRLPVKPAFFVNLSNDGWFKGWEEHEQHAVSARFRAIESRRAIARSVNMGVSCVIDGNGRIVALPAGATTLSQAKALPAVIDAVVPIDHRESWYPRLGDWLPGLCWLLVFGGLAAALWQARREERLGPAPAANPV